MADSPTSSPEDKVGSDVASSFRKQVKVRFYRLLNYIVLFIFILLVNGGLLATDFILFSMVEWFLHNDVQKYPFLETWFNYVKIALAFLVLLAAVVHGILSMISQVRLDWMISRELERE
jgi:hypothetical protein